MADERYWRNGKGYWRSATNANGLDMQDCDLLHQQENEGRSLERKDLEKVDRYTLSDIARWARQECVAALQGRGRGYTFAGRLAHYAEQDRFRNDVAKIGSLPRIPEPPPDRDSSLFDRVDAYNAHVRYATRDIRNQAERSREAGSPVPAHEPKDGSARHRRAERFPEIDRDPPRGGDPTETPVQAPRGAAVSPQRSAHAEPGDRAGGVSRRRSRKRSRSPEI